MNAQPDEAQAGADTPAQADQAAPERKPMPKPAGGWPRDEYTGIAGDYIRDPFTGIRTPVPKPEGLAAEPKPAAYGAPF